MDFTPDAVDDLLSWSEPVNDSVNPDTLREWRFDLIRCSVYLSYAVDVLSLDLRVLEQSRHAPDLDILQSLVDELPNLLASEAHGESTEVVSHNAAADVAVAELAINQAAGLLALHHELVESDLHDLDVIRRLVEDCERERERLLERRRRVDERVRQIQDTMQHHYASGAASTDDWLR